MTDPVIQNIPVRTEEGGKIKAAFQQPATEADYSALELRIMAHEEEPTYDLNQPEDVFVQLDDGQVCHISVISDTSGFCSCEKDNGCLDDMIEQTCEFPDPFGSYVIEGCTGIYIRGDGWMTDDDADFYPGTIRPATAEEISNYG